MDLVIHRLDHEQVVATVGPVNMRIISSARTETEDIDHLVELIQTVLRRSPTVGMWAIAHHGAPIPTPVVMRYGGKALKPYRDRVSISYSMLGLGFWASAAISTTKLVFKAIGAEAPITTSVVEGARRLSMDMIGLNPDELVAAYESLAQRMRGASSAA